MVPSSLARFFVSRLLDQCLDAGRFLGGQSPIVQKGRHQPFRRAPADGIDQFNHLLARRGPARDDRRIEERPPHHAVLEPALALHPFEHGGTVSLASSRPSAKS